MFYKKQLKEHSTGTMLVFALSEGAFILGRNMNDHRRIDDSSFKVCGL
jgi:hypothetical protein